MLWADGESFAQVIEGEGDNVETTMERISKDYRHTDIMVLLDRPVLSRQFGDWSMRLASDDASSDHATTFMIGFAMGQQSASARQLYSIVMKGASKDE